MPLLLTGVVAGTLPAAAADGPRTSVPAASIAVSGQLNAVAATSARDARASWSPKTVEPVTAHWNGTAWKQVSNSALELTAISSG